MYNYRVPLLTISLWLSINSIGQTGILTGNNSQVINPDQSLPAQSILRQSDDSLIVTATVNDDSTEYMVEWWNWPSNPPFDVVQMDSISITSDSTIIIIMNELILPPENLYVDPLTSWAYWDYPRITALREIFENDTFPPAGWLALSNGIGWFDTINGSSPNWQIPNWNSKYACVNDDAAGPGNDGCCDYLISPPLDLRNSMEYILQFNSFFNGNHGQKAFIEFSYDGGNSWQNLDSLQPFYFSWNFIEIDLSEISGPTAIYPVWIAFHADDAGKQASGWTIDNVKITGGILNPLNFFVYLDSAFINATDTSTYQFEFLTYGTTYTASVKARYTSGLSEPVCYTFTSEYLIPPRNLDGMIFDVSVELWWEPPLEPPITYEVLGEEPRTEMPDPNADYSPTVRTISVTGGNSSNRDQWDVQFSFVPGFAGGEAGVETDGDYIYTSQWNAGNGTFYKYELDGTYLGPFTISGCQDVRDLAYEDNENLFYGSNAGTQVWGMDFVGQAVVNSISAPTETRAIAYDSCNDGFWANNLSTDITLFDKTGAFVQSFPVGAFGSHYGFAYDPWTDGGPYLWAFSQDGSGGELVQYEIATGSIIFNMSVYPYVGGSAIAGGLFTHCEMIYPNIATIGGTNQNELIWGMELINCQGGGPGPYVVPDNLIGYNVYRNSDTIAYIPYNGEDTTYYYDINPCSTYFSLIYNVSAIYDLEPYGLPGDTAESMLEGPMWVWCSYPPLPFEEPWVSGTFELNQWTHGDNWRVNGQIGNPEPAAEFTWDPVLTDYHSDLTSYPLDGINLSDPWIDGCIWFDFDLRLDDRNTTGGETFSIEVGNEDGWHKLIEYDNADGSFDWISHHFDITACAFQNIFRVRFVAEGNNSSDIQSWFVDNIYIYRTCSGPYDLTAKKFSLTEIHLNWHSPFVCGTGVPGYGQWIHWDSGENAGGIGLAGGGTFSVASHWDPDMITPYEGMSITRVRFVPYEDALTSTFMMKVWEGANAGTLLYEQEATGLILGEWNEIEFTTPVAIDVTKELWFGYTTASTEWEHPAGHDPGPAIAGYGDMITLDGTSWDLLSNYGLDYNWTLQAYVASADGETTQLVPLTDMTVYNTPDAELSEEVGDVNIPAPSDDNRELQGYNIYLSDEFLDFTADTFYIHTIDSNGLYIYIVTAVYEDCESDTAAGPDSVSVYTGTNQIILNAGLMIYPVPAHNLIHIHSEHQIDAIQLRDLLGQTIFETGTCGTSFNINTTALKNGVYLLYIQIDDSLITRKVLINH